MMVVIGFEMDSAGNKLTFSLTPWFATSVPISSTSEWENAQSFHNLSEFFFFFNCVVYPWL